MLFQASGSDVQITGCSFNQPGMIADETVSYCQLAFSKVYSLCCFYLWILRGSVSFNRTTLGIIIVGASQVGGTPWVLHQQSVHTRSSHTR